MQVRQVPPGPSHPGAPSAARAGAGRKLLVLLLAMCLALAAASPVAAADPPGPDRLTNLAHLDFLGAQVAPREQEGHTTHELGERPEIGVVWTYADRRDDGSYERIGGGAYDAATDTYGQGAFNADDISRAAVVYLRHWRDFGDDHSRDRAEALLRGLTYLQTVEGEHAGNVVLWMQPDGTLNPSAEPVELPDPSDSGDSYWLARTIWALGEGYRAFAGVDPHFAAFLRERLELAIAAVDRQLLEPAAGELQLVDGLEWPAWLIADGADASAEAVYGLAAYLEAGSGGTGSDGAARRTLTLLADGITRMQRGDARTWPYGAHLPWAQSRSVWHGWGSQMAGALATAGIVTGEHGWVAGAVREVAGFTPHLLVQGGPDNGWSPAPVDPTQIAYGADATLQNLLRTYEATGREGFAEVAGIAAAWYFGNNPAGAQMYDPETGRTFDGVNADGTVNRNSGAESTIHGLLSMLALDAHPGVAAAAGVAERIGQVTWQLVEAESGRLDGGAEVATPDSAWTGESQWSGGAYVSLPPGASLTVDADLPVAGRYRMAAVAERQEMPAWRARLRLALGGRVTGVAPQGGAGQQGVTATSGYLDVGRFGWATPQPVGSVPLQVTAGGTGPSRLDALLVQPEVEWLALAGSGARRLLLRSFATAPTTQRLAVDGADELTARAYDDRGRLVREVGGRHQTVHAPVLPGGFTVVTGSG